MTEKRRPPTVQEIVDDRAKFEIELRQRLAREMIQSTNTYAIETAGTEFVISELEQMLLSLRAVIRWSK